MNDLDISFSYSLEGPHSKQVCHHGTETWGKAGLGNESQLELSQANDIISSFPVPAWNVKKVGLVMILHKLDDDSDII